MLTHTMAYVPFILKSFSESVLAWYHIVNRTHSENYTMVQTFSHNKKHLKIRLPIVITTTYTTMQYQLKHIHDIWYTVEIQISIYSDDVMGMMVSQITVVWGVFSTVCSGGDQGTHQSSRHWPLWGEFTGDRWIPRTKDQKRGKCFHLMTSSCQKPNCSLVTATSTCALTVLHYISSTDRSPTSPMVLCFMLPRAIPTTYTHDI